MEQIKVINNQAVKKLMDAFPGSFINHCFEFIADIRINSYIRLDNVPDELTLKAKVIEYFSRPAFKGEYFRSHSKNQEIYDFHLRGLNEFLGTNFTTEEIEDIYCKLGNGINRTLTLKFIKSGYNMQVVRRNEENKN